ncbi:hypothetical protein [Parasphingorhabdus sp.]|uniref:hypothetical protein n=1 Tax=Parasphingorhabdus sp. TaxID=2709688 RepID=UPI003264DFF6
MSKGHQILLSAALLSLSATAYAAGGWTNNVAPTKIEIVRSQGFMILGDYGDPGATPCATSSGIWVLIEHSQYKELLSTALTAVTGQLKLQAYVHSCTAIGWHGGDWNTLSNSGAIYISR